MKVRRTVPGERYSYMTELRVAALAQPHGVGQFVRGQRQEVVLAGADGVGSEPV